MKFPASILLFCLAIALPGCDYSQADVFAISFQNDTGRTVELRLCDDARCTHYDYTVRLRPGEADSQNISTDVFARWAVDTPTGWRLGCVPLRFDRPYEGAKFRLSQVVACSGAKSVSLTAGRPAS